MGRKRKYLGGSEKERSNERVKAFREKRKLQNTSKANAIARIESAQKKQEGRRGLLRVNSKEISCNEVLYLTKRNNTEEHILFLRSFDPLTKITSVTFKENLTLNQGLEKLGKITSQERENFWFSFCSLREDARAFVEAYSEERENKLIWGNKIFSFGFMCMLNEVLEEEGKGEFRKLKKTINIQSVFDRRCVRREIASYFNATIFKNGQSKEEIKKLLEVMMVNIIENMLQRNKKDLRKNSCKEKINMLRDVIKVLEEFPRVYDTLSPEKMLAAIDNAKFQILESYKKKKHSSDEFGLTENDHNPFIPIAQLKQILDLAWESSTDLYYFIILTLTVGGREDEMRRLINNPAEYLLADGTLDYNNSKRRKSISDYLIQKTVDTVDVTTLTNPLVSIVGRMILLYEKPRAHPTKFFRNKKKGFRSNSELRDYHERTLRTTCATFLAYCSKLTGQGRALFSDVSLRLAHSDASMAIRVYAKKFPSSQSPINYFETRPSLKIGTVDIAAHSTLWDTWLLKDFLKRKEEYFRNKKAQETEIDEFYSRLMKESAFYNQRAGVDESIVGDDDEFRWLARNLKKAA